MILQLGAFRVYKGNKTTLYHPHTSYYLSHSLPRLTSLQHFLAFLLTSSIIFSPTSFLTYFLTHSLPYSLPYTFLTSSLTSLPLYHNCTLTSSVTHFLYSHTLSHALLLLFALTFPLPLILLFFYFIFCSCFYSSFFIF